MFDHECPSISNNKLNMSKSDCVARIASGDRKCATCPAGVGYVKPVKKRPGRKKHPPKPPQIRMCKCGINEVAPNMVICKDCRVKNRVLSQAKSRAKTERSRTVASIAFHEKKLAELRLRMRQFDR